MPNIFEGTEEPLFVSGRVGIVVSRFNQVITENLLTGAVETFVDKGFPDEKIDVFHVPGAWELSLIARRLSVLKVDGKPKYGAIVCLGAVVKGETTHDEHINRQVSLSLGQISLDSGIPVVFGLLTCNSMEQAIHRSGGNVGNKGVDCALCALEMMQLLEKID
ncbi:MAG: 6,7-dimethyl-8-ribityllumazine synthase [Pirellulaceae bacterium]|nr:6,7-dimethyl-8-ribityllumazine synthase [Pirellulaceae bacterium]